MEELSTDLKLVKEENAHLSQYAEKFEELEKLENTGKKKTEVQEKQQRNLNCIVIDSNHSLQYIAKQCVNSYHLLLTVNVTNKKCLKSRYEFKEQKAFPDVTFIDIANALIGENETYYTNL